MIMQTSAGITNYEEQNFRRLLNLSNDINNKLAHICAKRASCLADYGVVWYADYGHLTIVVVG